VEAVPMPPYPAQVQGLYQWTKHMLDIRVAPLLGGIVVTNDVWNSLSETDRRSVSTAAAAFERRIEAAIPVLDRGSIEEMQKPGRDLSVTRLDAAATEAFHAEAEKLLATAGESLVPRTVFQAALRERAAFRAARR
jgi:TRAP-type C4-dicarboxylate transport system substrate-binding protein